MNVFDYAENDKENIKKPRLSDIQNSLNQKSQSSHK